VTSDLLLPGYWVDEASGAWCSIPWPTDPDERVSLARSSLGPQIINWSEGRTDEPGLIHYMTGKPWRWTPGQRRFLILWYALDEVGRFLYRTGIKRGAKGTGKDPMAAAMCDTELLGPVEPHDRDDRTGLWVGRARGFPLVQVMSNSEDQSKKVLRIANAMWSAEAREHYGLDPGETRTIIKGTGGRFEVPTSAEESSEGDPVTFAAINETHHMTQSNGGVDNAKVIYRNVGKSPATVQARAVEFTNAHRQGTDSVAERAFLAWQHQMAPGYRGKRDILYDSIEAPPGTDILTHEGRMAGLAAAYADSPWNDRERISDEMADIRTSVADSIRFYLNGLGAEEDAWVDPRNFDQFAEPRVVADREQIAVFVDCSKSHDATAATATRLSDLYTWEIGCWERPQGWPAKKPWRAPRDEVDATVRAAEARYSVSWLGVDPSPAKDDEDDALYWRDVIDGWRRDFGPRLPVWATPGVQGDPVRFDMRMSQPGGVRRNQEFTLAAEWVRQVIDGDADEEPPLSERLASTTFRWDGSARLRQHVHNARRRPNPWGVSLGKVTRDSGKLVDLAVCMVGSVMGARLALNSGKVRSTERLRTGQSVFRS